MGGSSGGTTTQTTQPAPPQIAPQFAPYAAQVGAQAMQYLQQHPITEWAGTFPNVVPGMSPLEVQAAQMVQQNMLQGMPQLQGQQALLNSVLPTIGNIAQQTVPLQPQQLQAMQLASQIPQVAAQVNPLTQAGASGLSTFLSQGGVSPQALQAAQDQITTNVLPQVENQMTLAGLGHSPALAQVETQALTGALLPLYLQGMQQQQSSASNLANLGMQQQGNVLQALSGPALQTGMTLGADVQQQQSDSINRALQAYQSMYQPLESATATQQQQLNDQINQALQVGALSRDITGQQNQAYQNELLRQMGLSEQFATAFLGAVPSLSTFPGTTTTTTPSSK